MAKIKEYPLTTGVGDDDLLLIETDDGTKTIHAKDLVNPYSKGQIDEIFEGKEAIANKTDSIVNNSMKYPSSKAVYAALERKENVANKKGVINDNSIEYPNSKAVFEALATKESTANKTDSIADDSTKYPSSKAVFGALTNKMQTEQLIADDVDTATETGKIYRVFESAPSGYGRELFSLMFFSTGANVEDLATQIKFSYSTNGNSEYNPISYRKGVITRIEDEELVVTWDEAWVGVEDKLNPKFIRAAASLIDTATDAKTIYYLYTVDKQNVVGSLIPLGNLSAGSRMTQYRFLSGSPYLDCRTGTVNDDGITVTWGNWVRYSTEEDLALKEDIANKKTVINDSSTEYPSSKAVFDALKSKTNFKMVSSDRTFAESASIPFIDDANENDTLYLIVSSRSAYIEGFMIFCGNKNRNGSNATQIRVSRDSTAGKTIGGVISYRTGTVQSDTTVSWPYNESDPDNPVALWGVIYFSDISHTSIEGKEKVENRVSAISASAPSDNKYPSEKAVRDYVSEKIGNIETALSQI